MFMVHDSWLNPILRWHCGGIGNPLATVPQARAVARVGIVRAAVVGVLLVIAIACRSEVHAGDAALPPVVDWRDAPMADAARELAPKLIPGLNLRCLAHEVTRPAFETGYVQTPLPQNVIDDRKQLRSVRLSRAATSAIIETGFESSHGLEVAARSGTHAVLAYAPLNDWFLIRVRSASGQTLRLELDHVAAMAWTGVVPVIADGEDPGDPALYRTRQSVADRMARLPAVSATWPRVPDMSGQRWRFVDRVWSEAGPPMAGMLASVESATAPSNRFVIEQRFTSDCALIAMRYPYTPSFHSQSLRRWRAIAASATGSHLRVLDLGKTRRGQEMAAMVVSGPGWPADRGRPIVVMYGREHGTETDSSWAVHGALDWLISDHPKAVAIRRGMTVVFIPCLDPDAAAAPCYENIIKGFISNVDECRRTLAVFTDLTELGYRIDAVIDLHNIQGGQSQWHGFAVMSDPMPRKAAAQDEWLGTHVRDRWYARGFAMKKVLPEPSSPRFRLGGFLAHYHGAMLLPIELNMQARPRKLRLDELQELGASMIDATHRWLTGGFAPDQDLAPSAAARTLGMSATVALARRTGDRFRALRAEARAIRLMASDPLVYGPSQCEIILNSKHGYGRDPLPPTRLFPLEDYDP